MPPANSVRIAPYPERCFFLGIGPNPKDVTVEILDLHFQGPLEMVWRISDFCARDQVSCVKRSNILQAYPHPHPWLALIVVRQKYGALLAGHAGKSIPSPPSQIKTKSLDAIRNTGIHVLDSKDGQGRTEIVLHGFCQTGLHARRIPKTTSTPELGVSTGPLRTRTDGSGLHLISITSFSLAALRSSIFFVSAWETFSSSSSARFCSSWLIFLSFSNLSIASLISRRMLRTAVR